MRNKVFSLKAQVLEYKAVIELLQVKLAGGSPPPLNHHSSFSGSNPAFLGVETPSEESSSPASNMETPSDVSSIPALGGVETPSELSSSPVLEIVAQTPLEVGDEDCPDTSLNTTVESIVTD